MQYWRGCGCSIIPLPELRGGQDTQILMLDAARAAVFVLTLVVAAFSCAQPQQQQAGNHQWESKQYGHFAQEESLRELLNDFASSVSVPMIVSPGVDAVVSGSFPLVSASQFLTRIAETYELAWVYDGTTFYIYDIGEIERKTLDLPYTLAEEFSRQLQRLEIRGVPLSWAVLPAQNAVQVSGPPRFIELVSETVDWAIKGRAGEAGDWGYTVRVFYIKYGYVGGAADDIHGKGAKVASLAEMLAQLMNVSHISRVVGDTSRNRKLLGTGLVPDEQPPQAATAAPPSAKEQSPGSTAYITSDPRLNAIIVRDFESRMPIYERLIRQLDVPQDQMQIQVTILDIRETDAESLGVNWSGGGQRGDVDFSLNGPIDVSLVMDASTASRIIARVSALEEKGRSRVVSRPSVLTLDNHEASFQSNQTFYVRLGTERSEAVDLVPVSYGSILRVRPHLIYEPEERKIHLSVHVEDGTRGESGAAVTEVPEVSRTVIQTRAVIGEQQSLLIGGYSLRERIESKRRIPLLGHIPLLGRLFTWKRENTMNFDRYFVITPTIVDTAIEYGLHTGFDNMDSVYDEVLQPRARNSNQEQPEKEEGRRQEPVPKEESASGEGGEGDSETRPDAVLAESGKKIPPVAVDVQPALEEESASGEGGEGDSETRPDAVLAEPGKKTPPVAVGVQPAPQRQQRYSIAPGDTLWAIADRLRPSRQVSVQQTMVAIFKTNPDAFADDNIHRMRIGYALRIPGLSEIQGQDADTARNQIRAHQQSVGGYSQEKSPSGRK